MNGLYHIASIFNKRPVYKVTKNFWVQYIFTPTMIMDWIYEFHNEKFSVTVKHHSMRQRIAIKMFFFIIIKMIAFMLGISPIHGPKSIHWNQNIITWENQVWNAVLCWSNREVRIKIWILTDLKRDEDLKLYNLSIY